MSQPAYHKQVHLVGREEPFGRLMAGVLSALGDGGRPADDRAESATAFLVSADPGIGKSALLEAVAGQASAAGVKVLSVAGRPDASMSSFEGLRLLLRPVMPYILGLPGQAGLTVRLVVEDHAPQPGIDASVDPALLRNGVLSALSDAAADVPLLICVDDFDQLDQGSRDVLLAVVGRLGDAAEERIAVVLAQRGDTVAGGMAAHCELIDLGPLDAAQSTALLDSLPRPPTGRVRLDVLRCAAGNPLALIELSRLAATDADRLRRAGDVLPVTDTLLAVFGGEVETMPPPARRALLLAAAGEERLPILEAAGHMDGAAWEPAEAAGLIAIGAGMVRFRHPLVRSAVLQSANEQERRHAHELLAAGLTSEPSRRAWHLSFSSAAPDDTVAAELAAYADTVQGRGDAVGAATLLQRAAEVSAPGLGRARRLIRAAVLAASAGHVSWVAELTFEADDTTGDADIHLQAAALAGWSLVMADRSAAALDRMLPAAQRLADEHGFDPSRLIFTSALPAYTIGDDQALNRFREAITRVVGDTLTVPSLPAQMLFPVAVAMPSEELHYRVATWPTGPAGAMTDPDHYATAAAVGAAAYVIDESRLAISLLSAVVDGLRRGTAPTPALSSLAALGWASIDVGRWSDATDIARELQRFNVVPQLPLLSAVASVQLAITGALRGPGSAASAAMSHAEATFDPHEDSALAAHLTVLRSRVAAADGDFVTAFRQLTTLFRDDGGLRHRHVASLAIGDLASAARRVGRIGSARRLIEPLLSGEDWRSARQRLVDARAAALLDADAGELLELLTECVQDPAGQQWPLDRALTYLDMADAAMRSRRVSAAREALLAAIDAFEQLGARAFEDRSRRELRATGVQVEPARADPLADLTDQQRQIVKMAAEGLSNSEIGQAMFLSPRTVASHLYRAFPKLGISSRTQLPAAVFPANEPSAL